MSEREPFKPLPTEATPEEVFDHTFAELPKLLGEPVPNQCLCPCHVRKKGFAMMHFTACCEGRCKKCDRYIQFPHLAEHVAGCDGVSPVHITPGADRDA